MPIILTEKLNDFLKYIDYIDKDKECVIINGINFINIHNSNFIKNKTL